MSGQELISAKKQVSVARNELKNIREKMKVLQNLQRTYVKQIEDVVEKCSDNCVVFTSKNCYSKQEKINVAEIDQYLEVKPIGFIHSAFKCKNATPRQPSICTLTTATVILNKEYFTNPNHALDGLQEFSHIWLMFLFHKNGKQSYCKGKVAPPRLDGKRIGVFSTRSPHRPNPIGLSLARLIKVEGDSLYLSGIDAVDGTPVIDIKPYIPAYDQPNISQECVNNLQELAKGNNLARSHADDDTTDHCPSSEQHKTVNHRAPDDLSITPPLYAVELKIAVSNSDVTVPSWIEYPLVKQLTVHWTTRAMRSFYTAQAVGQETAIEFDKFCGESETFKIITSILKEDPRSVYRRHQCRDQLYYFVFDFLHLTCWFDDSDCSVEIVKVCKLQDSENKRD